MCVHEYIWEPTRDLNQMVYLTAVQTLNDATCMWKYYHEGPLTNTYKGSEAKGGSKEYWTIAVIIIKGAMDNILKFSFKLNFIYQVKSDC